MKNKNSSGFLYHYIYSVFNRFGKGLKKCSSVGVSFFKITGIVLLFMVLAGSFSSCKTCKCPAYSYQGEEGSFERVRG